MLANYQTNNMATDVKANIRAVFLLRELNPYLEEEIKLLAQTKTLFLGETNGFEEMHISNSCANFIEICIQHGTYANVCFFKNQKDTEKAVHMVSQYYTNHNRRIARGTLTNGREFLGFIFSRPATMDNMSFLAYNRYCPTAGETYYFDYGLFLTNNNFEKYGVQVASAGEMAELVHFKVSLYLSKYTSKKDCTIRLLPSKGHSVFGRLFKISYQNVELLDSVLKCTAESATSYSKRRYVGVYVHGNPHPIGAFCHTLKPDKIAGVPEPFTNTWLDSLYRNELNTSKSKSQWEKRKRQYIEELQNTEALAVKSYHDFMVPYSYHTEKEL
jgi:hypothetical protein